MENDKLVRLSHAISAAKTGADDWDGGCNIERDRYIEKAFADIPAVDAVEVRHGRWIQKEDKDWAGGGKTLCSKCKYGYSWKMYFEPENFNFCPNCGAKMEVQDG